ncbi:MAG TPA: hypothetical protein VFK02_23470 [Kofleriaceae bacterium]|nr:hypothetical protein [Kofleriaceae bacterium]
MRSTASACVLGAILALACAARADGVDKVAMPQARGQAIVKAQLEAVKHWSDESAMSATFASSGFVLTPSGARPIAGAGSIASAIAFLNPHSTVKDATFDHFTAGGNAKLAWFTAELHFTVVSSEPGFGTTSEKHTVRAVELLEGAAGWKVTVAAFTNVAKLQAVGSCEITEPTPAGPLIKLLVDPAALAAALDPAAVVMGTDPAERGAGAAARTLLGKWKTIKLSLDTTQKLRELHVPEYGYAMANVKLEPPKPGGSPQAMSAFVLALPTPDGGWQVLAASYGATF